MNIPTTRKEFQNMTIADIRGHLENGALLVWCKLDGYMHLLVEGSRVPFAENRINYRRAEKAYNPPRSVSMTMIYSTSEREYFALKGYELVSNGRFIENKGMNGERELVKGQNVHRGMVSVRVEQIINEIDRKTGCASHTAVTLSVVENGERIYKTVVYHRITRVKIGVRYPKGMREAMT